MSKADFVDIVFDGPPSHISGRFVEVEDAQGRGTRFGTWVRRSDGFWVLRIEIIKARGEWICERHPELEWPHEECVGPGMPQEARIRALVYQRDQARLLLQEERGTVAAWKQECATLRAAK